MSLLQKPPCPHSLPSMGQAKADLFTRIYERKNHVGDALLGAVGDDDLRRAVEPVVPLELRTNRLTHILQPRYRRVVRDVVLDGFNACLFEHFWGVKIWLSEEGMTSTPDCFNSVAFRAMAMVADSERRLSS